MPLGTKIKKAKLNQRVQSQKVRLQKLEFSNT